MGKAFQYGVILLQVI